LIAELADMLQRMGRPRLLESRLFLLAPLFFLQRREVARQVAPVEKLESFLAIMDDQFIRLHVAMYRALAAATGEDLAAAEHLTDAAIALARTHHFNRLDFLCCVRAELHAARGQRDAARELAGAALDRARSPALANPFDQAVALRTLGEIIGGSDGAALLRESLAVARAHGNRLHAARALLALGQVAEARALFSELRADAWLAALARRP
jgi:hypothetical protein